MAEVQGRDIEQGVINLCLLAVYTMYRIYLCGLVGLRSRRDILMNNPLARRRERERKSKMNAMLYRTLISQRSLPMHASFCVAKGKKLQRSQTASGLWGSGRIPWFGSLGISALDMLIRSTT